MTRDKVIDELYRSSFIKELLYKITSGHQLLEDLKQELFIILCEMSDEKIMKAYNNHYLNYLCITIIKRQFHSSNSPFHKKFRKYKFTEFEDKYKVDIEDDSSEDKEYKLKEIEEIVDSLKYTDKELFKIYYKIGEYNINDGSKRDIACKKPISSTRKIEKKLGITGVPGKKKITIDHSTIALSIRRSKEIIKKKLRDDGIL